jgi:hypothetical protein
MTDRIDYTQRPEVLAACGWVRAYQDNHSTWYMGGDMEENPELTMQELWEALCKACKSLLDYGFLSPRIDGIWRVELVLRDGSAAWDDEDNLTLYYYVNEYGSLTNAVAAALHWVLQQGKENADE